MNEEVKYYLTMMLATLLGLVGIYYGAMIGASLGVKAATDSYEQEQERGVLVDIYWRAWNLHDRLRCDGLLKDQDTRGCPGPPGLPYIPKGSK